MTLREETEWVETIETGWNRLVGADPVRISQAVREAERLDDHPDLYGDGKASEMIVELIKGAYLN